MLASKFFKKIQNLAIHYVHFKAIKISLIRSQKKFSKTITGKPTHYKNQKFAFDYFAKIKKSSTKN
jgi:hypothetical protein